MAQQNGISQNNNNNTTLTNVDTDGILQALQLIHNPGTPNDERLQALQHLEQIKQRSDLAEIGHSFGSNVNNPPLVRHYGLSLLEHFIRHSSHQLSEEQSTQFRNMILGLSQTLDQTPQGFIRNKISGLWLELAKKSWALDWFDLDEHLVQLWFQNSTYKEFVLSILENLSADVFEREDSAAVLRTQDFRNAVVEIFCSRASYAGGVKIGDSVQQLRYGDEGWLSRITVFLNECLQNNTIDTSAKSTALAALATLRSVFTWSTTPPLVNAQCLPAVCQCLSRHDQEIILAALEILNALYGRGKLEEVEVQALVYPLCQAENVAMLEQVYSWSVVTIDDIDSPKYTVSKKVSELIANLADWIAHYAPAPDVDFSAFLRLVIEVAQHESLIVSITGAHCWQEFLLSPKWRKHDALKACIEPVLRFATQRIIAYDQVPEEAQEPGVLFVNDEIELHPDRQAFYITYRRLCISIIEAVAYNFLDHALEYLLNEVDQTLNAIVDAQHSFDPSSYNRTSIALLRLDAQFTIAEAAFRGVNRWVSSHKDGQHEQQGVQLRTKIKSWSTDTLAKRSFKDPLMKERMVKFAVETANKVLVSDTGFAMTVLEHILASFLPLQPQFPAYSDAVGECHSYASVELRRLALEHASYFVTFYDQLETKFSELTAAGEIDEKVQIDLKSTLFLVVQRADGVDAGVKKSRLESFLQPIAAAWSQRGEQLADFEGYQRIHGFDQVGPYMASCRAAQQQDWSSVTYGEDGAKVQSVIASTSSQLPLRETRVLLSVSTDRLDPNSELYRMVCELWTPMLAMIIPAVLRCVNYNQRLHDPTNWLNVSPEQRLTIKRIMRDRYWQSGISEGSMVEFHRKVKSTKSSLEGFASSVRGKIRTSLENCYSIVHSLGRLGSHFYRLPQIPESISSEMLETAPNLGLHHFGTLLSMLPKLIDECPPADRAYFLTPVLLTLLQVIDQKCTSEWQKMEAFKEGTKQDDNLSDEMRDESVLRQMTYRATNMVSQWLGPQYEFQVNKSARMANGTQNVQEKSFLMRDFILSNIHVLEPLLLFCTHAISFKDTKSCTLIVFALQRLVPQFATETHLQGQEAAAVREFISTEMLKTLITSLHDGYFADYQNQLALLIALIWTYYGLPAHVAATETQPAHDRPAWTSAPRNLLLQLPNMTAEKVDAAGARLLSEGVHGKHRKQRAVVLQLLEGVRGVRLSELGKIDTKAAHNKIMEKYRARDAMGMSGIEGRDVGTDDGGLGGTADIDLGGVADMFGN